MNDFQCVSVSYTLKQRVVIIRSASAGEFSKHYSSLMLGHLYKLNHIQLKWVGCYFGYMLICYLLFLNSVCYLGG